MQKGLKPETLVFLDETGTNTKMTRTRGRAMRGERLVASVPHGHWKTTTFLAGLRHDGITAPLVLDGSMNGLIFKAYVEQFLIPTLARGTHGDRSGGSKAPLLTTLFSRPQSDRNDLLKAQRNAEKVRTKNRCRIMGRNREDNRQYYAARMYELFRKSRI